MISCLTGSELNSAMGISLCRRVSGLTATLPSVLVYRGLEVPVVVGIYPKVSVNAERKVPTHAKHKFCPMQGRKRAPTRTHGLGQWTKAKFRKVATQTHIEQQKYI